MVLNKKLIKNIITLFFALILIAGMLALPEVSVNFALSGLNLWFTKMNPTLFPFMVVSGIMIQMNLVRPLCRPFSKSFAKLFGVNTHGVFCIIMGFLCGFPMGAKVITELYRKGQLSIKEADYLLAFCNNIGPIYFCSYVLVTLHITNKIPFLFGMYGIPLLYGVFLFHISKKNNLSGAALCETQSSLKFMEAVDTSIMSGIENITKLGGYMVFFNLFNMLPRLLLQKGIFPCFSYALKIKIMYFCSCFFEISNGVNLVKNKEPWLILTMIPFGGLCCMAQTYSLIKDTPLSISKYGIHKLMLTALTGGYYFLLSHYISL